MARRNKLQKFTEILTFSNVYENEDIKIPVLIGKDGETVDLRGKWRAQHFKNSNPLTLELACGGGEYTLGLARMYAESNFLGVDIKGARIWKGARVGLSENLANAAFLRTRIEKIASFFAENEIDNIWITFPDPFLHDSKENRRLTSPHFLKEYRKIVKKTGIIHLKTDSPELYDFTLATIAADQQCELLYKNDDIYGSLPLIMPELQLQTAYEMMHLAAAKTIKYIRFSIF